MGKHSVNLFVLLSTQIKIIVLETSFFSFFKEYLEGEKSKEMLRVISKSLQLTLENIVVTPTHDDSADSIVLSQYS